MLNIGTVTALLAAATGLLTLVTSWAAYRQRRVSNETYRLKGVERRYIAATAWIFEVRLWAAQRGLGASLPALPDMLGDRDELEAYVQARIANEATKP